MAKALVMLWHLQALRGCGKMLPIWVLRRVRLQLAYDFANKGCLA